SDYPCLLHCFPTRRSSDLVWTAWQKFLLPAPPAAIPLTLVGLGSLVVNLSCAFMLVRFRAHSGSLTRRIDSQRENPILPALEERSEEHTSELVTWPTRMPS